MDPFTMAMIGQSIGGGLEMFGGFGADRKAAKKADDRYEMSRDALLRQIGKTRIAYGKSEGLLKGNVAGINKGFGDAKASLGQFGNAARANALGQQKQQLGGLAQSMASRGLGGTTVLDNANRGIYSDTSRRLAEIDEAQGQMLSSLALGKTSAMGAARGDLANFYAQRNQAEISDRHDLISLWLNSIPQGSNPLAGMGKLGGQVGFGLGGGFK